MRAFLAICIVTAFAAAGCNTTRGAGKDIENTGSNIQQGINASTGNNTTADNSTGMNASTDGGIMNDSGTGGADTGVGSGNTPMGGY